MTYRVNHVWICLFDNGFFHSLHAFQQHYLFLFLNGLDRESQAGCVSWSNPCLFWLCRYQGLYWRNHFLTAFYSLILSEHTCQQTIHLYEEYLLPTSRKQERVHCTWSKLRKNQKANKENVQVPNPFGTTLLVRSTEMYFSYGKTSSPKLSLLGYNYKIASGEDRQSVSQLQVIYWIHLIHLSWPITINKSLRLLKV